MQSAASLPGVSSPNHDMTSSRPGGWPAACTGSAGTTSANRSRNHRVPYSSAASAGRYSLGPSNDRAGSNTRDHWSVPPRPAASASRSTMVRPNTAAAKPAGGTRAESSRGATSTATAKQMTDTASNGWAATPQLPTNGGCGRPSVRAGSTRTSPTTTVTAATNVAVTT